MGILWVFESKRTTTAFWMTFLLPYFGGFLYAGWWAIVLVPAALIGGLFLVLISLVLASIAAAATCGEGYFLHYSCTRNEDLSVVVGSGVFAIGIIGSLVIFGVIAAGLVSDQLDSD